MLIKRSHIRFNDEQINPPRPLTEIGHHISMNPMDISMAGRRSPLRADTSIAHASHQLTSF